MIVGCLKWVEHHPWKGFVLITTVMMLSTILVAAVSVWTIGAGWAYHRIHASLWTATAIGTLAAFTGIFIGAVIAFTAARYLMRECIEKKADCYKWFRAMK